MRNIEDLPNPTHALERLREMLQPVMLRRTKESSFDGVKILTLPARWVTFNESCSRVFICYGRQKEWWNMTGENARRGCCSYIQVLLPVNAYFI